MYTHVIITPLTPVLTDPQQSQSPEPESNGACNPTFFGTPLSASNYSASNSRYDVQLTEKHFSFVA